MNDVIWIKAMCKLLDDVYGPDIYKFKTVNKCLIIPQNCQPTFTYAHHDWKQQYRYAKSECQTQPKARCSLASSFENVKHTASSTEESTCTTWVPKWGGYAYLQDTITIKLTNTCPIDNYLTMFYLFLKERPEVIGMPRNSDVRYAKALVKVVGSFDDAATACGTP